MNRSNWSRRVYLGAMATSFSFLAGCSGDDDSGNNGMTPTMTQTSTPTPTPTPTPNPAEFEVVDVSAPDAIDLGESYQIEVEVANHGGEAGSYRDELDIVETTQPEPPWWDTQPIELWVPAGETRSWRSSTSIRERPGIVFYRLDGGQTRSIHIPQRKAPIIELTNLVSEWTSFGDAINNRIEEVPVGQVVNIASRYWYWQENQTYDAYLQMEIFDEGFNRVDISTRSSEQLADYNGWSQWESYSSFSSSDWESGSYTAEVLIRDNQNQAVSEVGQTEFQVVAE